MGLDQQKIIRTSRLSLTCIFLFLLTWYYQVPESAWCLITIWFVMFEYTTIGGVFTKSLIRFLGTFLSAVYGMIIVYCCANNPIVNIIAFVLGLFVYAYYFMGGEKTYIGTIGAVTLTIVLLNYNNVDVAILRVFNVILGILGSMFMVRFFYPNYARDMLLQLHIDLIENLAHIVDDYLNLTLSQATNKVNCSVREQAIFAKFTEFNRLINEAKIETRKTPLFIIHNKAALQHIRHLFRLINVFVFYLTTEDMRSTPWIRADLSQLLSNFQHLQHALAHHVPHFFASPINAEYSDHQNMNTIELILINIRKEAALLTQEITQIVFISSKYHHYRKPVPVFFSRLRYKLWS